MKKLAAILLPLVVAGGTLYLLFAFTTGSTTGGCATALLQGTLVEHDGTLAVESVPPGTISRVSWPFGYGVGSENGTLVLTHLFTTVARVGDQVSVGGGMASDDVTFAGCGPVTLGLMWPTQEAPSEPPRATLAIGGTAYEPCIPPPSGCGYWVTITSEAFGMDRAPLTLHRSYGSAVNGDPEPLTLGEGVSPWIEPGEYDVAFEVGAYSDAASPEPLEDGSLGYPPKVSVACTRRLVVPVGAAVVHLAAAFHGSTCDVTVRW
jgi:hypothetical protein